MAVLKRIGVFFAPATGALPGRWSRAEAGAADADRIAPLRRPPAQGALRHRPRNPSVARAANRPRARGLKAGVTLRYGHEVQSDAEYCGYPEIELWPSA